MSPDRRESLPSNIEPLFDADVIRESVEALGRKIEEDFGAEDPLLVALLGGSVIFLADLVRAIGRPVRYEFIDVGFSGSEENGAEVVQIRYPIPLEIAGQSVLVVKDVVSSGVTEPYLEQQLKDHGAREVRFAALIDMPDERKTEFDLHYRALSTERQGGLLVGYGLKHRGRYGNLPSVGRLSVES